MHRKPPSPQAWMLVCALLATPAQAGTLFLHNGGGPLSVPVRSLTELRFHNVVRQQYDFSCGSAALATLLAYHYDEPTTEQAVFQAMFETGNREKIRRYGFSLLDMKTYLESKGYQAEGYRVTLDDIARVKAPGIALLNLQGYRHFVVVKGIRGNQVLIGDPAKGLSSVSRQEFEAGWNGILFAIRHAPRRAGGNFDLDAEWAALPAPPIANGIDRSGLSNFTLSLPRPGDF